MFRLKSLYQNLTSKPVLILKYSTLTREVPSKCTKINFSTKELRCNHTDTTNTYRPKFSEVVEKRKNEARRSLVVQVHSSQSCSELHSYCSQFGVINTMNHYTAGKEQLHFILLEFDNELAVANILSHSCHVNDDETVSIPVSSHFLWFRALGKSKRKKIQTSGVVTPSIENGTKIFSQEDLEALLYNANDISEQMILLQSMTCLGDTGTRLRYLACRQIDLALSGMFPKCEALPFGSSVNSFGKEGCDLDIVLRFNSEKPPDESRLAYHSKALISNNRAQSQRHMECIADILQLFLPGCVNIRRILQARVPIIKYNQEQTGLECDLSMTNMTGVYMSDLLFTMGCIDERVRPLVFTIRRWAQQTNLTTNSPGRWITNFSLTLMVLFFLQKVQILPTLKLMMKLAENSDHVVTDDGVNCSILHDLTKLPSATVKNTDPLNVLLLQFYEYFATFDFQSYALSLNEGREILKPDSSALYIVNPLERHFNVSKNVSNEEVDRLKIELRNAAWALESQDFSKVKQNKSWGLLEIFKVKNIRTRNSYYTPNVQNRLVEIKGLFENDQQESEKSDDAVYKNEEIKATVKKIKTTTAEKIKNINKTLINSRNSNESNKIRVRRR